MRVRIDKNLIDKDPGGPDRIGRGRDELPQDDRRERASIPRELPSPWRQRIAAGKSSRTRGCSTRRRHCLVSVSFFALSGAKQGLSFRLVRAPI